MDARGAYIAELQEDHDKEDEEQEILKMQSGKRPASTCGSSTSTPIRKAKKGKIVKGPMDLLPFKNPEATINLGKANSQASVNDACDEEVRARFIQYIARFFYRNGIPFNVVKSESFKLMVAAIGKYGPHLKVPSYHEMRGPLLKKEMKKTKEMLKGHIKEWVNFGCSIMVDAWTDNNKTLINFMVNCPSGTMFVKSVDASSYMKTGMKVFELLDSFIEEIGEKDVVQVVTNDGSNYVLAGKLLEAKRNNLFWTPCAAHCVNSMLEDIGKLPRVKRTIKRGITLVSFIYNHTLALNMMRKFTNKMELVRHGVTRFATSFLTLQRLHKQKNNLRKMFTSNRWSKSRIAKEVKGKRVTNIVLMPTFWNDVVYSLKTMRPLVYILRLVYHEHTPAIGYMYEAIDKAKKAIQKAFNEKENKYKDIFDIIDRRWKSQVHHPLHIAGYFLNPKVYYSNPRIEFDSKVVEGLYKSIERLSETEEDEDKILTELAIYKTAAHTFGMKLAIEQRTLMDPAEWWMMFGSSAPNLQKFAIKVLSLTCSSSRYDCNWSTFVNIHFKKRSKLEHQKLQELVFVKYNQDLKERFDGLFPFDPILLNDIDDSNEWLVGEMGGDGGAEEKLVLNDDTLSWGVVADVTGAGESLKHTRQQAKLENFTSRPSSSRGKEPILDEEDFEDVETEEEEEEEEIYQSSSAESDSEEENMGEDIEDDNSD